LFGYIGNSLLLYVAAVSFTTASQKQRVRNKALLKCAFKEQKQGILSVSERQKQALLPAFKRQKTG